MRLSVFLLFLASTSVYASAMISCGPGQVRVQLQQGGVTCTSAYHPQPVSDCIYCNRNYPNHYANPWYHNSYYPYPTYAQTHFPWWAQQGNLYYPNMTYPGHWQHPGMNDRHYPGNDMVYAAKPNIYVESNKKIDFKLNFTAKKPSFLATTPMLADDNSWRGKINKNKFKVDGIQYDYLFYDARMDIAKMQFSAGICSKRDQAIQWMLSDLEKLGHSKASLADFKEHWQVKIPNEKYYCIYPQYNQQLDAAFPIMITPEVKNYRSLYILVPHKTELVVKKGQYPPLPNESPYKFRPKVEATDTALREWGVAFLSSSVFK